MAKTLIIFGAGASVPFFSLPITSYALTCAVQREARWKGLLARYTTAMADANCPVNWESISDLIGRAKVLKESVNFEELIGMFDMYSSYAIGDSVFANRRFGIESKRTHDLLRFFGVDQPSQHCQYWEMVPFLFRQMIAEVIEEQHNLFESTCYNDLVTKQSELLSGQLQEGALSVYSFNYDDVLHKTITVGELPLETGFLACRFSGRFNSVRFLKARSILAFLHGHARWSLDDAGIKSFRSISEANQWRLAHLSNFGVEETRNYVDALGAWDFNTFITTGLDKEPSFSRNPYSAYYQRISRDLLYADSVIVAGYSFRDPHIDRLLLNFLDLGPKKNKVLVVDLWEYDIDPVDEFTNPVGFLRRVLCKHGVPGIPVANTMDIRYKWDDRLTSTNKNGYGFLCPQIWIYKKGYGEFLSEWQTVLEEWRRSRDP